LERGYLALIARIPEANHVLHAAARTPEGLLIFDTCPSEDAFRSFYASDATKALFAEHGLVDGVIEDFPVIRAYARRSEVTDENWPDS